MCVWHIMFGLLVSARSHETWSCTNCSGRSACILAKCDKRKWASERVKQRQRQVLTEQEYCFIYRLSWFSFSLSASILNEPHAEIRFVRCVMFGYENDLWYSTLLLLLLLHFVVVYLCTFASHHHHHFRQSKNSIPFEDGTKWWKVMHTHFVYFVIEFFLPDYNGSTQDSADARARTHNYTLTRKSISSTCIIIQIGFDKRWAPIYLSGKRWKMLIMVVTVMAVQISNVKNAVELSMYVWARARVCVFIRDGIWEMWPCT